MQTSLRRLGNSTGLIVPRALLDEMGATTGTRMTLAVEDGKLVAAPVASPPREGWAAAATDLEQTAEEARWQAFGNVGDADLTW